ncbi:WGR domain-containing protein [Pseudooceanicola spongiae]|jgi:predicted DNA-binding WGR domain protein|uniref:WGR domain-containing protein n=1 Tax=Pseudooceanicola spongiae TaxID=2613965 RepID=A0A7L9WQP6_9RHOB|nr:WGR domain-containing protein [Pseudooceanicola spongiae]QOL82599.1 WGR domain-containing protein [Pseudooceanicola spongiae]
MTAQLELFPATLRLTRIDPGQNTRRFYRVALQPDLFGGCTLIQESGRIGQAGRVRAETFANEGVAVDALIDLRRQKARRGYQV